MTEDIIARQDLIANPAQYELNLGKNPRGILDYYTQENLLPPSIRLSVDGARKGYYAPIHLQILQEIIALKQTMKYAGIRQVLDDKYHLVFALHDILDLFGLRYLKESVLQSYLDTEVKDPTVVNEILLLYHNEASSQESQDVKKAVLNLIVQITETAQ